MADIIVCPICSKTLNNKNRLIKEDCGHSKCRQCLISEANGCEKCKENDTSNNIIEVPKSNEENSLDNGPKNRKSKIPLHIVKSQNGNNEVIYHCTICDKRFKSRTQQYYHLFCDNSSNKPFKCDECDTYFSTSAHLKYHISGHTLQSFQCSVCSKKFSKLQVLQKHEKLHNAVGEKCLECGAKLRNKEALNAHMMRHQNILPFECNKCDKKFSLRTSLRMHQQIVHVAANKFKCEICEKVFNRNSSLKTHSMSHSNQKEHNCSKCSRHFIDKKSLLRHSKIHNVKSKFKCTLCDTSSIRKDNILRHIRNMHPNEDKTCLKVVSEEYSENESSDDEEIVSKQLPSGITTPTTDPIATNSDIPKIVANSSVIRCIGNVKPVTIVREDDTKIQEKTIAPIVNNPVVKIHKKLKKPYDPREIYRKILLDDDDSTQDNETNSNNEDIPNPPHNDDQRKELVQESTVICNGQQSNFSETHWRKNFKYNYQIQFD